MNARRLWVYVGLLDLHEPGQYFDQVKRYNVCRLFLKSYSNWIIFDSCRKFEHKKYSGGWANSNTYTVDFDFALLQLKNGFDIPNIPNVSPACLPSMNKAPANVEARKGYGLCEVPSPS